MDVGFTRNELERRKSKKSKSRRFSEKLAERQYAKGRQIQQLPNKRLPDFDPRTRGATDICRNLVAIFEWN